MIPHDAPEAPRSNVLYLVPGSLGSGDAAAAELNRRRAFLNSSAPDGYVVSLARTSGGPTSVENEEQEAAAARAVVAEIPTLEGLGLDALVIGCFGDPGLTEVRSQADFLVVGPAGASFRAAERSGPRFAVLTVVDAVIPLIRRRINMLGMSRHVTSVSAIGVGVHELRPNCERILEQLTEAGRKAVREGAGALVLGCMTMGFLALEKDLSAELEVPVVNPVLAALDEVANLPRRQTDRAGPLPG